MNNWQLLAHAHLCEACFIWSNKRLKCQHSLIPCLNDSPSIEAQQWKQKHSLSWSRTHVACSSPPPQTPRTQQSFMELNLIWNWIWFVQCEISAVSNLLPWCASACFEFLSREDIWCVMILFSCAFTLLSLGLNSFVGLSLFEGNRIASLLFWNGMLFNRFDVTFHQIHLLSAQSNGFLGKTTTVTALLLMMMIN